MRKTALFNIAKDYHFNFAMRGNTCRLDGKTASIQLEFDDTGKVDFVTLTAEGWTYNFENDTLNADINAFLYGLAGKNFIAYKSKIKRLIVALDQYPGTDDFIDALEEIYAVR